MILFTSKIIYFKEGGLIVKENFIYAFWHRYQVLLAAFFRFRNICVLVSKSRDGEIIATAIKLLGFKAIRGSSSKSPVKSLILMIRALKNGYTVAFTPDGPRGPSRDVKEGVIIASKKLKKYVIPLAWYGNHFTLNTWDKLMIPKPFGKFVVIEGRPFTPQTKNDVYKNLTETEEMAKYIWKQYF